MQWLPNKYFVFILWFIIITKTIVMIFYIIIIIEHIFNAGNIYLILISNIYRIIENWFKWSRIILWFLNSL